MEKTAVAGKHKKFFYGKGGRKTSVCSCRLYKNGKGEFKINGRDYKDYFKTDRQKKSLLDAMVATGHDKDVDADFKARGGGLGSQADACRHALSRALEQMDAALRPVLKAQGFMKRDPRVKERKKPGLKRARRSPQWSKR